MYPHKGFELLKVDRVVVVGCDFIGARDGCEEKKYGNQRENLELLHHGLPTVLKEHGSRQSKAIRRFADNKERASRAPFTDSALSLD
jgi:hypothetical protein